MKTTTTTTIQQTYFDALFFASASQNEKKAFSLPPAEFKVLLKLIHYSTKEQYITWTSENISKHICAPVSSIDKSIQRLKRKGYIIVWHTQKTETHRTRTIQINWDLIQSIDNMYNEWVNSLEISDITAPSTEVSETPAIDEMPQPEPINKETDLEVDLNDLNIEDEVEHQIEEEVQPEAYNEEIEIVQDYSDISFTLNNGKEVKIPTDLVDYWNSIQEMKGLIRRLKNNHSHFTFQMELQDSYERNLAKANLYCGTCAAI